MEIWGIFFLDREKNFEALKELGITSSDREIIIRKIVTDDYVETIRDTIYNFGEMWVFGKDWDQNELYIKLSMGAPNSNVICVSLHKSEKKIRYAFKQD